MKSLSLLIISCLITLNVSAQTHFHEFDSKGRCDGPFTYSVSLPEGNYKVTVVFGAKKHPGSTIVRAESSRVMLDAVETDKGEFITETFAVNRRSPGFESDYVRLKSDVAAKLNWDDSLNFEFTGSAPCVKSISIEPADVVTVYLFGDSTVCDYDGEPYASWGQMIPAFFGPEVAFANYAETGETTNSCISSKRFAKGLSQVKAGDYVFLEFGHNDEKQTRPGSGAWYYYSTNLKIMIDQVKAKGAHPVLLTPTQRRRWKNGQLIDTHGEFPEAMRLVASREQCPLIDLTAMTTTMYIAMGEKGSEALLTHLPAGSLKGLDKDLKDNTHFSPFGAYETAKCVVQGIKDGIPGLSRYTKEGWVNFNPACPDAPESFMWYTRPKDTYQKPRGN
ncbi:MAG: rhamnogalacturonan acetylesterase [Bacteroidales bacterium]|nr:rhamnogalacturonan acetylesterase [Bacteroidales bacterium]